MGKLELRVPQDHSGHFSTELFERYQRSERALVATLVEMYVQGVSQSASIGTDGGRFWLPKWRPAKAARRGRTFSSS